MPHQKNKKHRFHPYKPQKLTYQNIDNELKKQNLHPMDKIYKCPSTRGWPMYSTIFFSTNNNLDLDHFLKQKLAQTQLNHSKISVLDSGAGQGVALNNLLNEHLDQIEKVVGISLHYFTPINNLLKKSLYGKIYKNIILQSYVKQIRNFFRVASLLNQHHLLIH